MARRGSEEGNVSTIGLLIPQESVAFDPDAFDEVLIRPNGVPFVHWRAMACPVGRTDPDDLRRSHPDHSNCTNGFILTRAGEVTVGFLSNSKNNRWEDVGRLDGSTVDIVLPRFYDGAAGGACEGEGVTCSREARRIYIAPFDRLYLKKESILVPTWEEVATSGHGLDRLRFPVAEVEDLVDSDGVRRLAGQDFVLEGGKLRWLPGQEPKVDPRTGKGQVFSCRYLYRPYWYVTRLPHEVRVAHVEAVEGADGVERMPQHAVLMREHAFENENPDLPGDARSPRQVPRPSDRTPGIIADLRDNLPSK